MGKIEKARIVFEDVESDRIITAMATNSSDELSIKFDFGDEGANSHDGLYATLFLMFAESLKNK